MRTLQLLPLLLALLLTHAACAPDPPAPATPAWPTTTAQQPGVALDGLVTSGVDEGCGDCHPDVVEAYTSSGMQHSLTLPTGDGSPEAAAVGTWIVHEPTGTRGRLELADGRYVQRLVYDDPTGVRRADHVFPVELIMGSGHAARSHLLVRDGVMFQLPLTWYAQLDGFDLSPGPGFRDGALRFVPQLCIGCHTGTVTPKDPNAERGYQGEISLGIACARCHGDGTEHSLDGDARSIVSPARLPVERQAELCFQCHLSGATELLLPGKTLSDYVPGQPLGAVIALLSPAGDGADGTSIAGHAARLQQSRCFAESEGLTCTTCHNPHEGHGDAATAARTARGCGVCHGPEACAEPEHGRGDRSCSSCHMPSVPSQDIVHTRTTDHRIQRRPPESTAVAGGKADLSLREDALADRPLVNLLDPDDQQPGARLAKAEGYLMGAELGRSPNGAPANGYLARAARIIDSELEARPDDARALLLRIRLLRVLGRPAQSLEIAEALLTANPTLVAARVEAGLAEAGRGNVEAAEAHLRAAWARLPYATHVPLALSDLLSRAQRPREALEVMDTAQERLGPFLELSQRAVVAALDAREFERALRYQWDVLLFRPREPMELAKAAAIAQRVGLPADVVQSLTDAAERR